MISSVNRLGDLSLPWKSGLVKPFIHIILNCLAGWLYSNYILDVMTSPMLGRSPIKWRQCPDMTTAVEHQTKPNKAHTINQAITLFQNDFITEYVGHLG